MSTALSKVLDRVEALETSLPFEALLNGIRMASPDELDLLRKILFAGVNVSKAASGAAEEEETKGKKRASKKGTTRGPSPWNSFAQEWRQEEAAKHGIKYESYFEGVDMSDEKAVKEAKSKFSKAADAVGLTWQVTLDRASLLWAARNGKSEEETLAKREADKAKRAAKRAAKEGESDAASVASTKSSKSSKAPKPSAASSAAAGGSAPKASAAAAAEPAKPAAAGQLAKEDKLAARKDKFRKDGFMELEYDGDSYYVNTNTNEVFAVKSKWVPGAEAIGTYDPEDNSVEFNEEEDSEEDEE